MSERRLKPRPTVFLEAARRVGEGASFACNAIKNTRSDRAPREVAFFEALLMPAVDGDGVEIESGEPWYDPLWNAETYDPVTARIMGLTLCAILAKEGWQ